MQVINWDVIKHPLNWVTVILMLVIASLFFNFGVKAVKAAHDS